MSTGVRVPTVRLTHGPRGMLRQPAILVAAVVVLAMFVGGWIGSARSHAMARRALAAADVRQDLARVHSMLLGVRISLYERDYRTARLRLEEARTSLRQAHQRSAGRRNGIALTTHDLARFEADLNDAQRLLVRLEDDGSGRVARATQ